MSGLMIDDRILSEPQYTPEQARRLGYTEEEIAEMFAVDREAVEGPRPVSVDDTESDG